MSFYKRVIILFFLALISTNSFADEDNNIFFGIELGAIYDSQSQTINGNKLNLLNHREAENKYNYRGVDSWTWLQGSKDLWIGTKLGDFENVKMAFYDYEHNADDKLSVFNFKFIRFNDGKEKIFYISTDTNFELNDVNKCKKLQRSYFDIYAKKLNMTKKAIAEEILYIKRGELGYAYNEKETISVALECYEKELYIDIKQHELDEEAMLLVN